ncbi:MAG: GNAT family N-acetyltransferase [Ilumatobacteraceae bacterium]
MSLQQTHLAPPIVTSTSVADWASIANASSALPEQTPEWIEAMCVAATYADASRTYRFADGRRYVLPLVRRRGLPLRLTRLWSYPNAWGFGGPVGDELDPIVVDHIVDDLGSLGVAGISIRINPTDEAAWRHTETSGSKIRIPRVAHIAELKGDPAAHLAGLSQQTRYSIRKAARRGVCLEIGAGGELLEDHYELFLKSVARWAERQREPLVLARHRAVRRDPLPKLAGIAAHLGDRFRVVVGYVDDRPAASAIILLGSTTRYTRGAIDSDLVRGTNASEAVHWRALEAAYEHGATWYNMGETGAGTGLARFKERFGAVAHAYGEYRMERLPISTVDRVGRRAIKRLVGFKD